MSAFDEFERIYGPPTDCEQPPTEDIEAYEGRLPADLLERWREVGLCAYGEGLLWFTNPRQLEDVLEDWVDFEPGGAIVFLRSAFAHLYLWQDRHVYSLDVQRGDIRLVTDDFDLFLTILCGEDVQEKILRRSLYREVKERLGPPQRDECYAFVPALALGGPGTADTVEKVKLREHLGLLAEMVQG